MLFRGTYRANTNNFHSARAPRLETEFVSFRFTFVTVSAQFGGTGGSVESELRLYKLRFFHLAVAHPCARDHKILDTHPE